MKTSLFLALVSLGALTGFYASAAPVPSTIIGPLTINWTLATAKLIGSPKFPGAGRTNITGKGSATTTNTVQVYTSSATIIPAFGNAGLLSLLSNSFNMTFPAGTKLVTDGGGVYVVDHTGTNQIVDASTVLTVASANPISSGVETVTTSVKHSSTNTTSVQSRSKSQFVVLSYDDTGLNTSDKTTTTFTFAGESASSSKITQTTSDVNTVIKSSGNFVVHGFGYGNLRGNNYLIQGTIMGTPAGTETESIFKPN